MAGGHSSKSKLDKITFPIIESLKDEFSYITEPLLNLNIRQSFQYLIYLISLITEYEIPGPVKFSFYKNMVIVSASIIEGSIYFALREMIRKGEIKSRDIMPTKWKIEKRALICSLKNQKQACGILEHKTFEKLTPKTHFIHLNRAAKRARLFDEDLFKSAEVIRERRNRIHLAGLGEMDVLSPEEVKDTLAKFSDIQKAIRIKLKELES